MIGFLPVMKAPTLLLTLLAGLLTNAALPLAYAETESDTPKATKKVKKNKKDKKDASEAAEKKEESVVGAILKKNTFFNNPTPNFDADFFIFLESASWCGPCNAEMPEVVKAYEQMKASGKVELILIGYDDTEQAAKGFLEKYKAKFPGVMRGASVPQIPAAQGIPHAVIMKADGSIIEDGHGSIIRGWKKQTIGEYAAIGDDGVARVGKATKEMKFANAKPSVKADFYIYMYMPDSASADTELLNELARSYKNMRKSKVELIFISNGKTPASISKLLRSHKAKFPGILKSADGVSDLPGLGELGTEASACVVTQSGAVITQGAPAIATKWEQFVNANK